MDAEAGVLPAGLPTLVASEDLGSIFLLYKEDGGMEGLFKGAWPKRSLPEGQPQILPKSELSSNSGSGLLSS